MDAETTARQSEFYELQADVNRLEPQLDVMDTSAGQAAIRAKMALYRKRQTELISWFADLLDSELEPARSALEKTYIVALAGLAETSHADLPAACEALAKVNAKRIKLHRELKRCARISGRSKPHFPIHAGVRANEITDGDKLMQAFLGHGEPATRGTGMRMTYGGLG